MSSSQAGIIEGVIDNTLLGVHTAFIAKIIEVEADGELTVQPLVRYLTRGGLANDMPKIYNVPVAMLGCGIGQFQFPLKEGDLGMCICSEVALGKWKAQKDKMTTPESPNRFSLQDCLFFPLALENKAVSSKNPTFDAGKAKLVLKNDATGLKAVLESILDALESLSTGGSFSGTINDFAASGAITWTSWSDSEAKAQIGKLLEDSP
jgi:hypothetical protein